MAVGFVIGRAGTGKTQRCLASIAAELRARPTGPWIFWLLPKQATFDAERRLTCEVGGYLRARVVSFEHLAREILSECGGGGVPEVTPLGRQMILGHLLRRHAGELKFFKNVARQPGLAAKLDATFAEFERCGKNAGDLDVLWREMGAPNADAAAAADDALLDKVHDLHLIYNAYSHYLGQERLDQHQRLLYVLRCLDESQMFRDATVYVDGFTDFSEYERRVLARLGKVCRHVQIALTMDPRSRLIVEPDLLPEEMSPFHPVEMAYRRLRMVFREEATPVDEPATVLKAARRFETPALEAVEKHAFGTPVVYVQRSAQGVEMLEAPTRAGEVDAAARRIQGLLAEGMRRREIAVLVRDLGPYHELIKSSFAEHGIRYFVDRRREMGHHPLLQFVRALLAIAQGGWPHDWLMTLLKTGLTGIPVDRVDAMENYVLEHRIRGEQWAAAWAFHRRGVSEDLEHEDMPERGHVDEDRQRLVAALRPFIERARRGASVKEIIAALFEVISSLPVRETIATWMESAKAEGNVELSSEHAQVWAELVALFDEMAELLGEEPMTAAAFSEVLEAGLEGFELALTPPTVDEVLVGQVDRTRTGPIEAVLVLGLSEGSFPAVPREDSVLSDSDRRELHRRNVEVSAATERRLLDEQFLAYRAFTCASRLLYLSRPRADAAGRAVAESSYWRRVREMFRMVPAVLRASAGEDASLIATPRQLVTGLMRWVRRQTGDPPISPFSRLACEPCPGASPATTAPEHGGQARRLNELNEPPPPAPHWPALYHWFATEAASLESLTKMRTGPWRALSYENAAALSPAVAAALWAEPLRGGVAEIESFAACPFMHFLRYGLELQTRQEADVSAMDLGHVFHHVLERVVATLLKQRKTWADLAEGQKQQIVRAAVEQIGHTLRGEVMLSTARNRYLLARIERTLGQVIATQQQGAARGNFRPGFARVRFGDGERLPELLVQTPKGREVRLSGTIDRVDVHEDGRTVAAIDYKLSNRTLSLGEVYHGLALQLLTYLLVLEASGEALAGKKLTPAAAFYVRMLRWLGEVEHPAEALAVEDPKFALQAKPRGLIDERIVREIDLGLQPGEKSDVVHAQLKKDGTFGSKGRSDLAGGEEFAALLGHVKRKIGELADGILDGEIGVAPYMMGSQTPCPTCEYRSVCRFEGSGYRSYPRMGRDEVLIALGEGERQGDKATRRQGEGA